MESPAKKYFVSSTSSNFTKSLWWTDFFHMKRTYFSVTFTISRNRFSSKQDLASDIVKRFSLLDKFHKTNNLKNKCFSGKSVLYKPYILLQEGQFPYERRCAYLIENGYVSHHQCPLAFDSQWLDKKSLSREKEKLLQNIISIQ